MTQDYDGSDIVARSSQINFGKIFLCLLFQW